MIWRLAFSKKTLVCIAIVFFLLTAGKTLAKELLIVEIQIGGQKSSDDFIKIYNLTDSDIYLGNHNGSYFRLVKRTQNSTKDYTIKSWSKEPGIKIPANGFYLWKNKDYTALIGENSSNSQTIAKNNGVALRLGPENSGEIIDAVGWGDFNNVLFEDNSFPENPKAGQKLKRKNMNGVYQDTRNNAADFYLEEIAKTKEQIQAKTNSVFYPQGVLINEILPSPKVSDQENEWIEIFNQNDFEVDISGWQMRDISGKKSIYTFPQRTLILPKSFLVLRRKESKIVLNNDEDGLELIKPNGEITDKVSYQSPKKGQSFNLIDGRWVWSEKLTPGLKNEVSGLAGSENESSPKKFLDKGLATASKGKFENGFVSLFLTAFLIATFSGLLFLIIRIKIKKNDFLKRIN